MFTKIKNYLKNLYYDKMEKPILEPIPPDIKKQQLIKRAFRCYFLGDEFFKPVKPMNINDLGITDIQFQDRGEVTVMKVTLLRPGLLIGKQGSTMDGLEKYFKEEYNLNVKISITENTWLWN